MESNQDASSADLAVATAPSSVLTPPDSGVGGKRPADQTVDQSASKQPRMSALTEGEDDRESLSDAQL